MTKPNLNLKNYGWVNAEVLWNEGAYYKLRFKHGFLKLKQVSEVFHHSEILNLKNIYIDKTLKIIEYDFG